MRAYCLAAWFFSILLPVPVIAGKFFVLETLPALDTYDDRVPDLDKVGVYAIFSRVRFDEAQIHFHSLVRIKSEAGRRDFNVVLPFENLKLLSGRVVDSDGETYKFDRKHDLSELLAFKTNDVEKKIRVLIPPGMTQDCLVELIYSIKAEGGLPKGEHSTIYPVNVPYFCLERSFEFSRAMRKFANPIWSDEVLEVVTRFVWTPYADQANFHQKVMGDYTTLTYTNVPALQEFPFGELRNKPGMGWVMVFLTMPFEGVQANTFWDEFAKLYPPIFFNFHFTRGNRYANWLRDVRDKLPKGDRKAAIRYVHTRFREAVTPVEMVSNDQLVALNSQEVERLPLDYDSFKIGFNRGIVFRPNFALFLFQTYKDLGFDPNLIFSQSVPSNPFYPEYLDAFALDMFDPVFGFDLGQEKWVFLMAARPEFQSGYLLPKFRDRPLLVVNPGEDWKTRFLHLPRDATKHNTNRRKYRVKVNDEGILNFQVAEKPVGQTAGALRRLLYGLPQEARVQYFEDIWHRQFPEGTIFRADVKNVRNFDKPILVQVKGGTRIDLDNDLIRMSPFPGDSMPLEIPHAWPNHRDTPITMPENLAWRSTSQLQLPEGWHLEWLPKWERRNDLGQVSFAVSPLEGKPGWYQAQRVVAIHNGVLPAEKESQLRDFLAWAERAYSEEITVRTGGRP